MAMLYRLLAAAGVAALMASPALADWEISGTYECKAAGFAIGTLTFNIEEESYIFIDVHGVQGSGVSTDNGEYSEIIDGPLYDSGLREMAWEENKLLIWGEDGNIPAPVVCDKVD
jgi:hypothetical protein